MLSSTSVCTAHGSDKAGLDVIHLLQTDLNRTVLTICGPGSAPPNSTVFLTFPFPHFPSKYFRVLSRNVERESRAGLERQRVIAETHWITPDVGDIIVLRPHDRNAVHYYTHLRRALREMYGLTTKPRAKSSMTPDQKKDLRVEAAKMARRAEHRALGW